MEIITALLVYLWTAFCYMDFRAPAFMFYRPVVAAAVTGIIMGNPTLGCLVAAETGLIYLGVIEIGGTAPPDAIIGSISAAVLMLQNNLPIASLGGVLLITVPVSVVATYISLSAGQIIPIALMHLGDIAAANGNTRVMTLYQWGWWALRGFLLGSLILVFIFFPSMAAALAAFPAWALHGLNGMRVGFAAVGLGMLLNVSFKTKFVGFFLLGFGVATFLHVDVVGVLILCAAIIAVIMYIEHMLGK